MGNKRGATIYRFNNKLSIFPKCNRSNSQSDSLLNYILPSSNRSTRVFNQPSNSIFLDSKRSQVTIFIILALIIVVVILIIFLLKLKGTNIMQVIDENNPQGSIETCTKQAVEDGLERITANGGDINPGFSVQYKNENWVYICYSGEYYKQCSYQRPLLVEHIQRELVQYITPKIEDCFQKLKMKIGQSSTVIDSPGIKVSVNLFPKHVGIKIEKDFRITRGDSTVSFDKFNIVILHPIYDLLTLPWRLEINRQNIVILIH